MSVVGLLLTALTLIAGDVQADATARLRHQKNLAECVHGKDERATYESGLNACNVLIMEGNGSAEVYSYRGALRVYLGQYQAGLDDLNMAMPNLGDPDAPWVIQARADALFELKRYPEALKDLAAVIRVAAPQSNDARHAFRDRARIYFIQRRFRSALDDLDHVIGVHASWNPEDWYLRGLAKDRLGVAGSGDDYRWARGQNPKVDDNMAFYRGIK